MYLEGFMEIMNKKDNFTLNQKLPADMFQQTFQFLAWYWRNVVCPGSVKEANEQHRNNTRERGRKK